MATLLQIPGQSSPDSALAADALQFLEQSGYYERAVVIHLDVKFSKNNRQMGAFKAAFRGTSSKAMSIMHTKDPKSGRYPIMAKAIFQGTHSNGAVVLARAPRQLQDLGMEAHCLIFGHAFLNLVYGYVDKWCHEKGETRQTAKISTGIPNVRFIAAGMGIQQRGGDNPRVILVEEFINGSFTKYINNADAQVLPQRCSDTEAKVIGEFLAFSQHVQYWKTKKQVFVTDYQGRLIASDR